MSATGMTGAWRIGRTWATLALLGWLGGNSGCGHGGPARSAAEFESAAAGGLRHLGRAAPPVAADESSRRFLVGAYRVELGAAADGGAEVSDDVMEGMLVGAYPSQRGWVFVSRGGGVGRSGSFAGPLEVSYPAPGGVGQPSPRGPLIRSSDGRLLQGENAASMRAMRSLEPYVIAAATLLPDGRGAAADATGALLRTEDGGITWIPDGSIGRGDLGSGSWHTDERWAAEIWGLGRGPFDPAFMAALHSRHGRSPWNAAVEATLGQEGRRREALEAALRRHPEAISSISSSDARQLGERLVGGTRGLWRIEPGGRVSELIVPRRCSHLGWGIAACPDQLLELRSGRTIPYAQGPPPLPVAGDEAADRFLLAGCLGAGEFPACQGERCPPEAIIGALGPTASGSACVADFERETITPIPDMPDSSILAIDDRGLLIESPGSLSWVSLDGSTRRELQRPAGVSTRRAKRWADGSVALPFDSEGSATRIRRFDASGSFVDLVLPEGARSAEGLGQDGVLAWGPGGTWIRQAEGSAWVPLPAEEAAELDPWICGREGCLRGGKSYSLAPYAAPLVYHAPPEIAVSEGLRCRVHARDGNPTRLVSSGAAEGDVDERIELRWRSGGRQRRAHSQLPVPWLLTVLDQGGVEILDATAESILLRACLFSQERLECVVVQAGPEGIRPHPPLDTELGMLVADGSTLLVAAGESSAGPQASFVPADGTQSTQLRLDSSHVAGLAQLDGSGYVLFGIGASGGWLRRLVALRPGRRRILQVDLHQALTRICETSSEDRLLLVPGAAIDLEGEDPSLPSEAALLELPLGESILELGFEADHRACLRAIRPRGNSIGALLEREGDGRLRGWIGAASPDTPTQMQHALECAQP